MQDLYVMWYCEEFECLKCLTLLPSSVTESDPVLAVLEVDLVWSEQQANNHVEIERKALPSR